MVSKYSSPIVKKRLVLCVVSTAISIGVLFFVSEAAIRCCTGRSMVVQQIESGNPFTISSDRFYLLRDTPHGKRLVRNARVMILKHQLTNRDIPINTNSQGFRYEDISEQKELSEKRILFLGDSVTLNNFLPENETFTKIAEYALRKQHSDQQLKLINAGVEDIGLSEEISILKEEGLAIHPDLVVVDFYLNDSRPPWGFEKETGHPGFLRRNSRAIEWFYDRFKISQWFKSTGEERMQWVNKQYELKTWQTDQQTFRQLAESAKFDWGAAWQEDSWGSVKEKLSELKRLSSQYGFAVAVIAFPVNFQVKTVFMDNMPQQTLSTISTNLGFAFHDLLPTLRQVNEKDDEDKKPDRQELFLDQAHLSTYGNQIVGKNIADFLDSLL